MFSRRLLVVLCHVLHQHPLVLLVGPGGLALQAASAEAAEGATVEVTRQQVLSRNSVWTFKLDMLSNMSIYRSVRKKTNPNLIQSFY